MARRIRRSPATCTACHSAGSAYFRPVDLVECTFEIDTQEIRAQAPLAPLGQALAQFDQALPYFEKLLGEYGSLQEHAALFRQAVLSADKPFITIELEEIAGLAASEEAYYGLIRAALAGIGNDFTTASRDRLLEIAQFRGLQRFSPMRHLLDDLRVPDEEAWNHCLVAGAAAIVAGIGRPVPWEPG